MTKSRKLTRFKTRKQEEAFCQTHDSPYLDWNQPKHASLPNLKPSTKTISWRLPEDLLNEIRILANKEDVPYQSSMKMVLVNGINTLQAHGNFHK